jgi:uncharacterized protein
MVLSLLEKWRKYRSDLTDEFYLSIEDLLEDQSVMELDKFTHHYCYTRLKHSLDVSYNSFFIAKLLHWDSRSVARAGLLHDLFFYDWRDEEYEGKNHAVEHPKVALENAKKICDLNKVEEDIILKHMWLVTPTPPRYREGYIVTFMDKYCASRELLVSLFTRRARRLRAVYESI